jgi:RHS repeat-associated protein
MTNLHRLVFSSALLLLALTASRAPHLGAQQASGQADKTRGQTTTLLPDGSTLLLGGESSRPAAAIYDPATRATRTIGRLRNGRAWHTATVLPDGTVLIAGGIGADGQLVADVERLDPQTGDFTSIQDAAFTPRARHTATLLSDGRVLFAGGDTPGGGGTRAEVWDRTSNIVDAVAGPPRMDRIGGIAKLLPDGRVRLSGGVDRSARGLAADEFFDPALSAFSVLDAPAAEAAASGVVGVFPADGSVDVAPTTVVSLRFSEPVDVRSVAADLSSRTKALAPLSARVVVAEGGMLAFMVTASPLAPGTEFRLTLRSARTVTGADVPAFSSVFTTAAAPDTQNAADDSDADDVRAADSRSGLESPWRRLRPLQAPAGVTALAGQVLRLNGNPLADVTLSIGRRQVQTDRTGRFLLRLGSAPSGWEEMLIDGTTANHGRRKYGTFEVAVQLVERKTVALPYTIWMPALDTANAVRIASPTVKETVITTPKIPGLELHLPPHTVVTDHDGKVVREVSITPIPVDQPPFPLPSGVQVPIYFTIQPGGAYVAVKSYGSGQTGAWLVYPNYRNQPVGTEHQFWHYDPEEKGWHVYGMGRVSPNGRQVVPNPGVSLYQFTGAMILAGLFPGLFGGNGPLGADPVNLSNGEFLVDNTDLVVADVIPLTLTRTYRTGDDASRPFGIGATHPYAMFLWSANQYTEADLILPNGKRVHYVRTSPGTGWTDAVFEHTTSPTAFYKSTIVWNGNGWDLTLKDGTVYVFGSEAPLQSIRDRFGNTVTLSWSSSNAFGSGVGNIVKVTSPNGRWIAFTYDGSDRITQAKDNLNRTVGYEYDGSGRLWKITDSRGGVTEYTYDIAHQMLTLKNPRGIVYLANEYDVNGRVEQQTQADGGEYHFAYTVNGGGAVTQTDVTNPRGYVRRLTFNSDGFKTADTRALGEAVEQTTTYTRVSGSNLVETATDELGRVTRYTYDGRGNKTSITRLYGTADAVTTSFTYDPVYSLLTSLTDPLNHTTTLTYAAQGQAQAIANPLGHETTFATNSAGQLLSVTNPLSKTTTFTYDAGLLASLHTPLGHTLTWLVDGVGRRLRATDARGASVRLEHNADDQITKVTDPLAGEMTLTYDGNGNQLTLTDSRNKTTTWTYDEMDRVATRTDALSRSENFEYDLNGNLTKWTDRKGQVTTYQYDALDRRTFIGFGTTGVPPSYSSTISTTYDAGNRATVIDDSLAGAIERTYDLLGRLTEEVTAEGSVTYTHDDAGRRETMTVAGQTAVAYTFDNADRLTAVTKGAASAVMTYDNANRRSTLTLPNGTVVEYGYDDDSRLTSLTYEHGMTTLGSLTYAYDSAGNPTVAGGSYARTTLPPALASATYDDANQIDDWGSTSFTYDDNGLLTSDGVRTYTWNARSQLASVTGPVSASFAYDAVGRRRSRTVAGTTREFLYDGLNIVQELDGASPPANLLTGLALDELLTRTDGAGARYYLPDALGSIVALLDGSGTPQTEYTYGPFGATTAGGSATTNPFAFTGREVDGTGLQYSRARYYDSRLQRFLSEDPIGFRGGPNLFAYVANRPTVFMDPFGLQGSRRSGAGQGAGPNAGAPAGQDPNDPPPPDAENPDRERDCGPTLGQQVVPDIGSPNTMDTIITTTAYEATAAVGSGVNTTVGVGTTVLGGGAPLLAGAAAAAQRRNQMDGLCASLGLSCGQPNTPPKCRY